MLDRVQRGVVAGLAAAAACGVVAVIANLTGASPQFNPPMLLARATGTQPNLVLGWLVHFLVYGVLLGALFGAFGRRFSNLGYGLSGLFFALFTYAGVAFVFLPAAGAGLFGMDLGYVTVAVLLIAHLTFGFTLGEVYARLAGRDREGLRG